ncbi:MAG: Rne/Rng family ribonuclease [Phycisphaerae bacterium]
MQSDSSEDSSDLSADMIHVSEIASPSDKIGGPAAEAGPTNSRLSLNKPRHRRRGGRGRGSRSRGKSGRPKTAVPVVPSVSEETPGTVAATTAAADLGTHDQQSEMPPTLMRPVDQPAPPSTISPQDAGWRPDSILQTDQRSQPASLSPPGSSLSGSAGYRMLRPNPNRVIARAAPGVNKHPGRRSFSRTKIRQQFRPSGAASAITPSEFAEGMLADVSVAAPGDNNQLPFPAAHIAPGHSEPISGHHSPGVREHSAFTPSAEAMQDSAFSPAELDSEPEPAGEEAVQPAVPKKKGPPKIMLVNVADLEEVRIAIVCQGVLEELYTERSSHDLHVGNIYKGRVTNVEPSIQAAFIDFGIGKNGFLHISDLHPQYFPQHHKSTAKMLAAGAKKADAPQHPDTDQTVEPQGAVTFEEIGGDADELFDEDVDFRVDNDHIAPMERVGRKTPRYSRPPIQQCLRRGQEIIVQVTKEGIGTKGPTLTSYVSVPGRYLVMMPGMSALGVSRKIVDDEQRRAVKRLLRELHPPENLGFIIRTAGIDRTARELQQDLHFLVQIWKRITHRLDTQRTPTLLYEESDLVIRSIRDLAVQDMDRIVVDDPDVAERVRDFLTIASPDSSIVELYQDPMPLFIRYGVEREIEKINSHRVEMANGGSLVIDSTEALVAVDVNSGRYREQRDAELTAFNINKDAIVELCRQLRLRDLGGVIVIDFIDMREERHKRDIEHLLREELRNDRAKTKVLRMSQFCMIEMTRQRVKPSLKRGLYQDCPHCRGAALIKTPESVTLDVMRRLAAATLHHDIARIELKVYPTVAEYLLNKKRRELVAMEDRTEKKIIITPDPALPDDSVLLEAYDARGNLVNFPL